eukprot:TRINITY_DN37326_c0_g1_i3.p1 TRINITY_DN37326_c0_g1~~TRINITY_DN37326_c0_g1_i3.p1  ORF type:complete len:684 (+),score=189.42 TRINITY_DN37326_c0_g1_i3:42-2054(+)
MPAVFDTNVLQIHKKIGNGAFGMVYLASWQQIESKRKLRNLFGSSGKKSEVSYQAIKQMSKIHVIERSYIEQTLEERDIMCSMNHPFVCSAKMVFQDQENLYISMPYYSMGDLWGILHDRKGFSETECRWFGSQLVLALEHIHSQKVIHRDLKPGNILVDENYYIALTDFGISKRLESDNLVFAKEGTKGYTAPEVLMKARHGTGVDWFALGVVLYYLYYGRKPFGRRRDNSLVIAQRICHGSVSFPKSHFFGSMSRELKSLIRMLLVPNMAKRLGGNALNGANEVKKHPFFKGIDWEALSRKELRLSLGPLPSSISFESASVGSVMSANTNSNYSNCTLSGVVPLNSNLLNFRQPDSPLLGSSELPTLSTSQVPTSIIWKPSIKGSNEVKNEKKIDESLTKATMKTITLSKVSKPVTSMPIYERIGENVWYSNSFSVKSEVGEGSKHSGNMSRKIPLEMQEAFEDFDMKELPIDMKKTMTCGKPESRHSCSASASTISSQNGSPEIDETANKTIRRVSSVNSPSPLLPIRKPVSTSTSQSPSKRPLTTATSNNAGSGRKLKSLSPPPSNSRLTVRHLASMKQSSSKSVQVEAIMQERKRTIAEEMKALKFRQPYQQEQQELKRCNTRMHPCASMSSLARSKSIARPILDKSRSAKRLVAMNPKRCSRNG